MALMARIGDAWVEFGTVVADKGPRVLSMTAPINEDQFQKKVIKKKDAIVFLVVTFNSALDHTTGYKQYDFASPWLMRVDVSVRSMPKGYGALRKGIPVGGYTIKRHGKHGEIPDFAWYMTEFDELYPYKRLDVPKKRKKQE